MEITNKTKKPISIILPGGGKLFLSPGKTGQVTQKAIESPFLAKLIETGDIELTEKGVKRPSGSSGGGSGGATEGGRHQGSGAKRQSGDR